jgi:type VII secretion protein EccB
MATKKDLTEAYAFSRRRLVTAFVSGAPGGREVEPARPGRTIVGGLALAVLLVAGAAVAGVFSPRTEEGWADSPGLIVSEETGAAYVITPAAEGEEPVLRPVINITSAMLILGADTVPTIIPDEEIEAEPRGDDIGILGAPATVPGPDRLIDDGWTACADAEGGIRVEVTRDPVHQPVEDGGALLVEVPGDGDDAVYVIAESGASEVETETRAYSYRVPASAGRDNLLDLIGLPEDESAVPVSEDWLALFPAGGELSRDSFRLSGVGGTPDYADEIPELRDYAIGDVVATSTGTKLLLTEEDPVTLSEFAYGVYAGAESLDEPPVVSTLELGRGTPAYREARWPTEPVSHEVGDQCAQLVASADRRPSVQVVSLPEDAPAVIAPEVGTRDIVVDAGAGAYVLAGGWDDTTGGDPHLVDAKGERYPLVGVETPGLLGYGDYPAPHVPDSWLELFREGVALSQNSALCPPRPESGKPCA